MGSVALARVVVGLTGALTVVAGCGQGGDAGKPPSAVASSAPSASPSPTISAAAALEAAIRKLNDQSVSVGFTTHGSKITADVDPASRTIHMIFSTVATSPAVGIQMIVMDRVTYAKVAGIRGVPTRWLRFDSSALLGSQLDLLPKDDPLGTKGLITALATVERDGERGFRGTLDMTKATIAGVDGLHEGGGKADSVPFTALLNDKGQLTLLTIQMGVAVPGLDDFSATYTGFGQPVTVTPPPAGETIDAPAGVLAILKA